MLIDGFQSFQRNNQLSEEEVETLKVTFIKFCDDFYGSGCYIKLKGKNFNSLRQQLHLSGFSSGENFAP